MAGTCILHSPQGVKAETPNGKCNHSEIEHFGNVCMVVTQQELSSLPTEEKYCPCKGDPNLIRLFNTIGYVEPRGDDLFITKVCGSCGEEVLLKRDEELCMYCKLRPEFYQPVNPEVYEETRVKLLEENTPFSI